MPRLLVPPRSMLLLLRVLHWIKNMDENHLDKVGTSRQQHEPGDEQGVVCRRVCWGVLPSSEHESVPDYNVCLC